MKNFTSGLLAGAILTTSIGTYAATNGRVIEVLDNVKKIVVNKVEKPFNKNNAPFIYNGTTYVPLRFVADALGEDVNWDAKTATIFIGEGYSVNNKGTIVSSMTHMGQSIKSGWVKENEFSEVNPRYNSSSISNWTTENKDNIGNRYGNGLLYSMYSSMSGPASRIFAEREYYTAKKYSSVQGKFVLSETTKNTKYEAKLMIYADDKIVYESPVIGNGSLPVDFNVNISGAQKVKFKIETGQDHSSFEHLIDCGIVNTVFN